MAITYQALPTDIVRKLQAGGLDANGQAPERAISDGNGNPCRHCLKEVEAGREMLILAHQPFPVPQPYAEVGPIFLCAEQCERNPETSELPWILQNKEKILMRGYMANDRIKYGSGQVIARDQIPARADELFADPEIAYIHLRSSTNNCFQCRIDRSD